MRLEYFILVVLLFAILIGALAWVYNSSVGSTAARASGLSCFSVQLPETDPHQSCDEMCATKGAAAQADAVG